MPKAKALVSVHTLPILWVGSDEMPAKMINQAHISRDGSIEHGSYILTLGLASPPLLTGQTVEERSEQAKQIPHVLVHPVGKFGLSEERLRELSTLLSGMVASIDEEAGGHGK